LILTDGNSEMKLSDLGKGIRLRTLETRFEKPFNASLVFPAPARPEPDPIRVRKRPLEPDPVVRIPEIQPSRERRRDRER